MDWWLASFFIGSILSLFLPIVPDIFVLFLLISLSIAFFCYKPLRLSSGLFFGASWMLCNAFNYQSLWQENNLNSLELATAAQWVKGEVSSLQSSANSIQLNRNKESLRFNLLVTHVNAKNLNSAINIRLSWNSANFAVQQGQIVRLKVKFRPAHGLANIGGFSYQTWLRSKRILATGYVINDEDNSIVITTNSIRQQLFNSYKNLLPEHDLSPLLLALGFGSRGELNKQLWQVLQRTGTGHLIAISGLHIGLVATGSYFFFMLFIRLSPLNFCNRLRFFQTINIRYVVIAMSLSIGLIYGYLAGFSLPTIRALLMLAIYWFSRLLSLRISIKRWLLLTLFLLTLMTPFSLFTASFWLSVYAITIIFLTLWRFKSVLNSGNTAWRFIKGLLVIQLSLTFMLLPISALFFQQVSLVALFANLVAVPWMSFFSIPLCLLSVLVMPFSEVLSEFLVVCCLDSLQALWHYLNFLSQQIWAVEKLSSINIQLLVLLGISSLFWLFQFPVLSTNLIKNEKKLMTKLFVVVSSSTLLFFTLKPTTFSMDTLSKNTLNANTININNTNVHSPKSANDIPWQLVIFDVGQGLSVLVQRNKKSILYDTGAAYPSGFNMADAVILPYLQHTGVNQLDKVIISHSDNDHAGGLAEIEKSIVVNELVYNSKQGERNAICLQGKSFFWQNLHFKMLWPKTIVSKENDDSCVLLISDGKHSVLLTGDISKKIEAVLLQEYPKLSTNILVVPHHGSKTSSSELFITKLDPEFAVVSAGYLNRWRMPVNEVVERYQQQSIKLLTTAKSGQIIFTMSEQGITKQSYYDDLWPFWFAR